MSQVYVTGLACGASDVTGLACVMASVRQMSCHVMLNCLSIFFYHSDCHSTMSCVVNQLRKLTMVLL